MCQNRSEDSAIQVDFDRIPISAIRHPTQCFLSQSLNAKKVLLADNNCQRDWRGFAHLAGVNVSSILLTDLDPTLKILTQWSDNKKTASFQDFLEILGKIDRWDAYDDVIESLTEDARTYLCKTERSGNLLYNSENLQNIKENLITESGDSKSHIETLQQRILTEGQVSKTDNHQEITSINGLITRSDIDRVERNLPLQRYDAFVIFADADMPFVLTLVKKLEQQSEFKFVLCLKDRDILGGLSFEHDAVMSLIRERCNQLIVIVSNAFLLSSLNNFLVQYAATLQIEKGCRKVIPCLYENCDLPPVLNCFSCLKYEQAGALYDFWSRLTDSMRAGRLQYSRTMNFVFYEEEEENKDVDVNEISEPDIENCIPITELGTANIEKLDVTSNSEIEVSRASTSKFKKCYKGIRRRLLSTFS